ncbi:hypothetical protein LY76DRAFT_194548 [Colletotrichum caudatum]|nr:hypothetical protein LY76DRAFT_194548 [Colletotrichum caudatum]
MLGCWTCFKQSPRVAVTWATRPTKTCIRACAARRWSCIHPVVHDGKAMRAVLAPCQKGENRSKEIGTGGGKSFDGWARPLACPDVSTPQKAYWNCEEGTEAGHILGWRSTQVLVYLVWPPIVYCRHPRSHPHQCQRRSMMVALYDAGLG